MVSVVKSKLLRLRVIVHNGKKVSKQFACSQEGKRDSVAIANMQSYVQSKEAIVKSKFFHCLPSGKTDNSAIAEIQTFVDSVSFHTWLESGYIHNGSVHSGIPTRRF